MYTNIRKSTKGNKKTEEKNKKQRGSRPPQSGGSGHKTTMLNDPLEEILQKKTPEERFILKVQEAKSGCIQEKRTGRCEYYEHDYMQCKRAGGLCLNIQ
jgi:hypothetical protein